MEDYRPFKVGWLISDVVRRLERHGRPTHIGRAVDQRSHGSTGRPSKMNARSSAGHRSKRTWSGDPFLSRSDSCTRHIGLLLARAAWHSRR
eukprot:6664121-Prymnesium_polylepis.1